jgi:hypothetical protein
VVRIPARASRLGSALAVWALLVLALPAEGARAPKPPPRARPARSIPSAVVTYVTGKVVVLRDKAAGRKVAVGDELPKGTRLSLGKSSQLTALWAGGERTTLRGPKKAVVLAPQQAPKKAAAPGSPSVLRNVWNAIRRRLGGGERGRAAMTEEPLAVRASDEAWQASPGDEQVRPGPIALSWRDPSGGAAQYLVIVWDENFAEVWRATTKGRSIALPDSLGLLPGRRYRWVVSSTTSLRASPTRWFEILTPERERTLEGDLACARDLFADVDPPSQTHVALGCIYESYGLISEARAEYEAAAKLSPGVEAYQALIEEPSQ